jgi:hypothetical protein
VIIRVDSPVDVLLTAPDGKQIGVHPETGLPVNDFGENGFDSGPGEPRFFGIHDSAPGDWIIESIGTAEGPFAINVYGIDLDQPLGSLARMAGRASLGSRLSTFVRLDAQADVSFLPATWNIDADGGWSAAGNWTGGLPNAAGLSAVLGGVITQPRTVTVDVPTTVSRISFDNTHAYTLAGASTLTLDSTAGPAEINVTRGSHSIGAPVNLADDTLITVSEAQSTLSITAEINAAAVTLTKAGAGTLSLGRLRAGGLSINDGKVSLLPGGSAGASVVGTLSIAGDAAPTATFDLTDRSAVIDFPAAGTSPAATVREQILAGRGSTGLGPAWNGPGITSSTAQADTATSPNSTSVGYAVNSEMPLGAISMFGGQPVDPSSVLVGYTRTGDANLDGVVNNDDVTIVGASYAPGFAKPSWALGDFDYNGFVDNDDVTLLGVFYNPSAPPLAAPTVVDAALSTVPEPSALWLLAGAMGALWIVRRSILAAP